MEYVHGHIPGESESLREQLSRLMADRNLFSSEAVARDHQIRELKETVAAQEAEIKALRERDFKGTEADENTGLAEKLNQLEAANEALCATLGTLEQKHQYAKDYINEKLHAHGVTFDELYQEFETRDAVRQERDEARRGMEMACQARDAAREKRARALEKLKVARARYRKAEASPKSLEEARSAQSGMQDEDAETAGVSGQQEYRNAQEMLRTAWAERKATLKELDSLRVKYKNLLDAREEPQEIHAEKLESLRAERDNLRQLLEDLGADHEATLQELKAARAAYEQAKKEFEEEDESLKETDGLIVAMDALPSDRMEQEPVRGESEEERHGEVLDGFDELERAIGAFNVSSGRTGQALVKETSEEEEHDESPEGLDGTTDALNASLAEKQQALEEKTTQLHAAEQTIETLATKLEAARAKLEIARKQAGKFQAFKLKVEAEREQAKREREDREQEHLKLMREIARERTLRKRVDLPKAGVSNLEAHAGVLNSETQAMSSWGLG